MKSIQTKFASGILLALLLCPVLSAQQDLTEKQKAVMCFDVRVTALMESQFMNSVGQEQIQQAAEEMALPAPPQNFKRIFGLVGAPESMQAMMEMDGPGGAGKPLPLDFLIEYEFTDKASANSMFAELGLDPDNPTEINGVKFFTPPSFAPQNIMGGQKTPTSVTFGTKRFIQSESPKSLFSEELLKLWSQQNDSPVRFSIEAKTRADFLAEVLEVANADAPPEIAPMLGLIDNVETLNLMLDPDAQQMLALHAMGTDEANAEELRSGLAGLLQMAKFAGSGLASQMEGDAPNIASVINSVMGDLRAVGEGREVNIIIGKPEAMEGAIREMETVVRAKALEASRLNDFRQVVLAMHNYESTFMNFPFDAASTKRNESLSWRVALLPYIEQDGMYNQMDLTVGPGDEPNSKFVDQMPALFGSDGTNSQIAFVKSNVKSFADISDGTTNTIVMIEYPTGVPWMENKDVTVDEVVAMMANLKEGESRIAARYDGSVTRLPQGISEEALRNLLDPSDGNVVEDY